MSPMSESEESDGRLRLHIRMPNMGSECVCSCCVRECGWTCTFHIWRSSIYFYCKFKLKYLCSWACFLRCSTLWRLAGSQCKHLRWRQPLHSDALTHSEPDLIYSHLELQTNSVRYIAINRCGASCIYCYECDFIAFSSAIDVPVQMRFFLSRSARLACLLHAPIDCYHLFVRCVLSVAFWKCMLCRVVVQGGGGASTCWLAIHFLFFCVKIFVRLIFTWNCVCCQRNFVSRRCRGENRPRTRSWVNSPTPLPHARKKLVICSNAYKQH